MDEALKAQILDIHKACRGYHVEFLSFWDFGGVGRAWMKELFVFVWLKKSHLNTLQAALQ